MFNIDDIDPTRRPIVDPRLFERDTRRRVDTAQQLYDLAAVDPTIAAHITGWQRGGFPSFEEMLTALACHLAREKAEYLKTATRAVNAAPPASIIITPPKKPKP